VPRRSIALATLAAATALLLTGCAEPQAAIPAVPASSPTPSAIEMATPAPTPAPTLSGAPNGRTVSLTVHRSAPPLLAHEGPTWYVLAADPASSSVEIAWMDTPSPGCGAVKDVWVQETSKDVTIDLARSARNVDTTCPDVLVPRRATVPLDSPLGSRRLLEESGGPMVPRPCPSPLSATPASPDIACPLGSTNR
jgi:hypothetical protein